MLGILVNLARLGGMQLVIALTGIARNKTIALRLGPEGYGEFIQLSLIVLTGSVIAAMGFGMSLTRNVAATDDTADRQRLLAQANATNLLVAGVLIVLIAALVMLDPSVLSLVGLTSDPLVVISLLVILAYIPLEAAVQHRIGFLTGALDIKGMTAGRSVALLIGTAFSIPLIWFLGILGAAIQFTFMAFLIVALLDRRCRALGYSPWAVRFDRASLVMLARLGLASVVAGAVLQLSDLMTRTALVRSRDAAENGIYQAALSLTHQVRAVVLGSVGSYMVATLSKSTDRTTIVATANQLLAVVLPLAVAGFSGLGILSGPFIIILFSGEFLRAQALMPWLLASYFIHTMIWVMGAPLLALNRVAVWLSLELLFSIARLLIALALIPAWGMVGVAVGYSAATIVHFSLNWWYFSQKLGFTIERRQWWLFGAGVPVVAGTATLGAIDVFDVNAVVLGLTVVGAYLLVSAHVVVGLPRLIDRFRTMIRGDRRA